MKNNQQGAAVLQAETLLIAGQRRRARLVEADRKVTVMQITMNYNSGMQKSITEHTTYQSQATATEDLISIINT